MQQLHQCLTEAHVGVEDIFKKNLSSLIYTNGLDLQVNNHMGNLSGMASHVNDATQIILEVAKNTADVAEVVREQQEQLTVTIAEIANDSDKVYADFTFAVEDNQVYVTSNNPYILYNDIYGFTMPEYEPTWSLVVGPSLFLGYDPIGHARISQGDLPFSVGVGVSLTIGYNIKSGGKKTKSYKKKK